jgi:hypothetical protein
VNRKKKQPKFHVKVSPRLGENGLKLLLTWIFDNIHYSLFEERAACCVGSMFEEVADALAIP